MPNPNNKNKIPSKGMRDLWREDATKVERWMGGAKSTYDRRTLDLIKAVRELTDAVDLLAESDTIRYIQRCTFCGSMWAGETEQVYEGSCADCGKDYIQPPLQSPNLYVPEGWTEGGIVQGEVNIFVSGPIKPVKKE